MHEPGALTDLPQPECQLGRDVLVSAVTAFLAGQVGDTLAGIREDLEYQIDQAGPDALGRLSARLARAGAGWDYYPGDPLARRIHHVLGDRLLPPGSALVGLEHAAAVAGKQVVVFANHLSYSDANLLEFMLARSGGASLSDRFTVVAGPKVYSSLSRRFSSLCFGTIKTPQSSTVSSEDAVMSSRLVARAARRCLEIAEERRRLGDALLVFPEGRRSRSGRMQPVLAGVTRYFENLETWILPAAITGTEAMFPVDNDTYHPAPIVVRFGPPLESRALWSRAGGNRRLMTDGLGFAVAGLLPPEYRGVYADDQRGFDAARRLLTDV